MQGEPAQQQHDAQGHHQFDQAKTTVAFSLPACELHLSRLHTPMTLDSRHT
ncbi:MAG: hypothetical protein VX137_07155 [Pseudomonadota bacterium]|nr:hypothetical protein [Pseudomonadota bacterium]